MLNEREYQWHQLFMRFANDVANMSYAKRLKVGAVAVKHLRVVAIGYNGTPAGEDNQCEHIRDGQLVTKPNVIHAEDNLIRFANDNNIDLNGCTLYITHSPCPECCDKVANAGFTKMIYGKPFRLTLGLEFLKSKHIDIVEWN